LGLQNGHIHVIDKIQAHGLSVFTLCPVDPQMLLSGGRDGAIMMWQITEDYRLMLTHKIPAHLSTVNHIISLAPLPCWASAGRDKMIKIWEHPTGRLLKVIDSTKLHGHIHSVNRLLWQADSNTLFSCGDDATLMAWQVEADI
jgi:WD40 repeat protein